MMPDTAPLTQTVSVAVPPQAAGASATLAVVDAGFAGFVRSATYVPNGAIAGAAAPNNRTLRVVNVGPGAAGGGVAATVTLDGTNNTAALGALSIPTVVPPNYTPRYDPGLNYANENPNTGQTGSATYVPPVIVPTASTFAAGDVLEYQTTANGMGVADPGGELQIVLERAGNV